ncbi:diguanylate cyclase (GGDEF) domain-containing protein [Ruminococcus sp. YE71]|uniref:EAL domain-containing protein n=1 Tax=unclassified Ruminococcus TaxID=2608920 RepID=UPI00088A19E8|nr:MULTISPECIES: EAL domain-containing protein [unclassified Ruminococcus]SDA20971.1 diguanylate cyclase (GGDEF) domain-containing protein [Ruminococcus sp. YE78]SFW33244.1 diguanylate cyclase (GGDEF) domain-containing protein [Ruminococcus sp. YE71]
MLENDIIFKKIAEALLVDYTSVYYVNAVTNEYQWYSADPEFHSLHLEQHGSDFFKDLITDSEKVIYEDDKHIFQHDIQKDKLLEKIGKGDMHNIIYRLMIDGKPVYHTLRLIRGMSDESDYFIFGVINIDTEYREKLEAERLQNEREIFDQIAGSLAEHYDTLYYVDLETNSYFEYSSTDTYKKLNIPVTGDDFFTESEKNLRRCVYPDDLEKVLEIYKKETILQNLSVNRLFTDSYRLLVDGEVMHIRCSHILTNDKKHLIICIENINSEISAIEELNESRRKSITYGQIAQSLASHYDVIYYVDMKTRNYQEFTAKSIYGSFEFQEDGKDFFYESHRYARSLVHPDDLNSVLSVLSRDYLISALEDKKQFSLDYRLIVDGSTQYTRMTIMWSGDSAHFIIGVENIDAEVRKKMAQQEALDHASQLALRDELTGTKNKNAYRELEKTVQNSISSKNGCDPFAVAVCDINGLKHINDTLGHKKGDEYICSACKMICDIFSHSPVYRIGGDEFVVFLRGKDYSLREDLMTDLSAQVGENIRKKQGPIVAAGISEFDPDTDTKISDVFERADAKMYENKVRLKEKQTLSESYSADSKEIYIPQQRKHQLDALYQAFSIIAEGTYIYFCDMKYDYSRWSKSAVDTFGLPSNYMFGAGDIWEKHIHPEDKESYRASIADLFSGKSKGHDMQYRAMKANGKYVVCTCRGIVLYDHNGEPDYFGGIIRNHGIQGYTDTLTGLRNQYGFFDDIRSNLIRNIEMKLVLTGIGKFSEINEVFGYQFGNLVLQKFGRYLFDHVNNTGSVYRLDGTRFAVITTLSKEEIATRYEQLRAHYREGIDINGKHVMLELNAGMLSVDNFAVDHQTVYACLNFAFGESKTRRHGDLVEFYNDLNDENKHRIEKLHAIRASITQGYEGFYLLYQPVVDAKTEKVIGAEALLRWRSDEYGTVAPDHFIPLLEKDPLFPELGEWILRTALMTAKKILEKDPEFIMNVNLSYTQLEKHNFVDMVLDILKETDFPNEHLCLEITERCRLLNMELLKNAVTNLRGRGVLIALDDFGTGFSSVGIVKNLPFDIIKIDRSFVNRIEEDEKERELIKSFAGVASTFGAKVCIEGIETAGMRDILQNYSVHSFQGYYYAKPIPDDQLFTMIEEHK